MSYAITVVLLVALVWWVETRLRQWVRYIEKRQVVHEKALQYLLGVQLDEDQERELPPEVRAARAQARAAQRQRAYSSAVESGFNPLARFYSNADDRPLADYVGARDSRSPDALR